MKADLYLLVEKASLTFGRPAISPFESQTQIGAFTKVPAAQIDLPFLRAPILARDANGRLAVAIDRQQVSSSPCAMGAGGDSNISDCI